MSTADKFVVSIMVSDRPGIMRDITSAITDLGGNINDISQTVVEVYFSVILTATFTPARSSDEIRFAIETNFKEPELSMIVKACSEMPEPESVKDGARYVMVVSGEDKPGILKTTTGFLAERSINIDDWTCHFESGNVNYIGYITIPSGVAVKQLQIDIKRELTDIGMTISIRHENIYRATNEVGPIKHLLT